MSALAVAKRRGFAPQRDALPRSARLTEGRQMRHFALDRAGVRLSE
jgi:hypothetical protein